MKEWEEALITIGKNIKDKTFDVDKEKIDAWLVKNTWKNRAKQLINASFCHMVGVSWIKSTDYAVWERQISEYKKDTSQPLVSIIMLNMDSTIYTVPAIESLRHGTVYGNYELILVDNGSKSQDNLNDIKKLTKEGMIDKVKWNKTNLGFAGGNNTGARLAKGRYHVYVNNDLIFNKGWLTALMKNMKEDIGLIGPVSNNAGSTNCPQRVFYKNQKAGQVWEAERLSGFCLLADTKKIGLPVWDEVFSQVDKGVFGCFEDDDVSVISRQKGYKNIIVGDSYVHHKMLGTFDLNKLDNSKSYKFNKQIFEAKHPKEKAHWWRDRKDISNEV